MNFDIEKFRDGDTRHLLAATKISDWTKQAPMCTIEPEEFGAMPRSWVAMGDGNIVLGHIGITRHDPTLTVIGRLIIGPQFRRQDIATGLARHAVLEAATELPPSREYLAYATYAAARTFRKVGGNLVGFREPEVPPRGNWVISLTEAVERERNMPRGQRMVY